MRVTNKMMADNITAQLFRQTEQMADTQEKIITGKRINRASDDPSGIINTLSYRRTISSLEQYNENISDGKLYINTVDNVLEITNKLLREAKQIAFDTSPDMRNEVANEVSLIRKQVLQLANHQIDGKYVFSGDTINTQPYDSTTWQYNGDNGTKDVILGDNMQVNLTADGSAAFGPDGSNVFDILNDLEAALLVPDSTAIKSQISRIDNAVERIDTVRAEHAGIHRRLEATKNHNDYFKVNVQQMLSQTEDADIAEAIIHFKVQQTTYESTLATSSMILQKSLIDFLR